MKRSVSIVMLALVATVPLFAQATKGWKMRVDRSMSAADPDAAGVNKFMAMGSGFHATNPQAAVYWNPENTVTGNYTLKGTFTLIKTTGYNEYYGLVFGGSALEGPGQTYLYFMVSDDGTWLVKRRNGNTSTQSVSEKTSNAAVKKPDASGKCTNALEVRVMGDKIQFVVNSTVVSTVPKTGPTEKTDGIYGLRVNHLLEVQVDGFALSKQ